MPKAIILFCIFTAVITLGGSVLAHDSAGSTEQLETVEWSSETEPPTLQLTTQSDTTNGWNVQVTSQNLPEGAHIHLFVDEKMETELYENNYTLSSLTPGNHYIGAVIASPDHHLYTVKGETIHSGTVITQPGLFLPTDDGVQKVADKSVVSWEVAAPYILGFFVVLGLFGFAMGAILSPEAESPFGS